MNIPLKIIEEQSTTRNLKQRKERSIMQLFIKMGLAFGMFNSLNNKKEAFVWLAFRYYGSTVLVYIQG